MVNQQATDLELGWLAGIIDGEGWLGMSVTHERRGTERSQRQRRTVKLELMVNNCDLAIIDKTVEILRKLGTNPYRKTQRQRGIRREVHSCAIKNMANIEKVLVALQDYLVGNKRERARLMMRFIELRRSNQGIESPNYANGAKGQLGPRTIRPYTAQELEIISLCRDLQSRGASETTRVKRDQAVQALYEQSARQTAR